MRISQNCVYNEYSIGLVIEYVTLRSVLRADWSGKKDQRFNGRLRSEADFSKKKYFEIQLPITLTCDYRSKWMACINSVMCTACTFSIMFPFKCGECQLQSRYNKTVV